MRSMFSIIHSTGSLWGTPPLSRGWAARAGEENAARKHGGVEKSFSLILRIYPDDARKTEKFFRIHGSEPDAYPTYQHFFAG